MNKKTTQIWSIVIAIIIIYGGLSYFTSLFSSIHSFILMILKSIYDFTHRSSYSARQGARVLLEKRKREAEENKIQPLNGSEDIFNKGKTGEAGYCYVGEDRTYRTCIAMGIHDKCMSGEIFQSKKVCEHPELRDV